MTWIPLHNHSHASLLDAISKSDKIAKKCNDLEYKACAITNHGVLSDCLTFHKEMKKKDIKPILGCLTPGQIIITDCGPKNIEDCNYNDKVFTHTGKFNKIKHLMKRKYVGNLYEIYLSNNTKPICVTEEHPILISNKKGLNWIRADKIKSGRKNKKKGIKQWNSYACLPKIQYQNKLTINLIDYIDNFVENDGNIQKKTKINKYDNLKTWKNIKNKQEIDKDFAYFLGLFCAEGSFGKRNQIINGDIRLTFNINEKKYQDFIINFVHNRFDIKCSIDIKKEKNVAEIRFCCLPIANFLKNVCGDGCRNKKLPIFLWNSNDEIRRSFVNGLLDGDGKGGNNKTLRTTSINLAWSLRQFLVNENEWLSVKKYNHQNKEAYTVSYTKNKKYKRCLYDDKYVYKPISHIKIKKINEYVYNMEVEDDNSYVGEVTFHNCELYISKKDSTIKTQENKNAHLVVLSKNKEGWRNLIKLVSRSNDEDVFYHKPRLDLERIRDYSKNIIAFSGHPGSTLAKCLFEKKCGSDNITDIQSALYSDCKQRAIDHINLLKSVFDDFFVEIQRIDSEKSNYTQILSDILREAAVATNTKCIATADSHYVNRQDAEDQRIILCSNLKTTLSKIHKQDNPPFGPFFSSDSFHIPTEQEIVDWGNTEEEIKNTELVADMCDFYEITNPPALPEYKWTDGMSESDYLKHLCREGWKQKCTNMWDKQEYGDRVKKELSVFDEAELNGYFLIVQDYVNWAKRKGWLIGAARGSAGGSLVSYLTNITSIDPIPFGLLFERFYNKGRNTETNISLPDIDTDFPIEKREEAIEYVRTKYGKERVCQMATFGRLQGKGAIKEVFRVLESCSFEEANEITKHIPQEHEIADRMESSGEKSILRWTLENEPKILENYCRLEDGEIVGDYANEFKQAMRLEGTYKSQGKHAAGVIISKHPLNEICPMIRDTHSDSKIAGIDMDGLKELGLVKFDFLGVASLSKLMTVNKLLRYGRIK